MKSLGNNLNDVNRLDYSFIMTKHFMIVVLRKTQFINLNDVKLSVNSLGYAGTLAVKS